VLQNKRGDWCPLKSIGRKDKERKRELQNGSLLMFRAPRFMVFKTKPAPALSLADFLLNPDFVGLPFNCSAIACVLKAGSRNECVIAHFQDTPLEFVIMESPAIPEINVTAYKETT